MTNHWDRLIELQIEKTYRDEAPADASDETEPANLPAQKPLSAAQVEALVEQKIQQAMSEGMFDNLRGAGKPLDLYDDLYVPDELKMAFRLMKGQGIAPVWIELQKDYHTGRDQYKAWFNRLQARWAAMNERDRLRNLTELRRKITDLNVMIHSFNAAVPSDSLRVGLLVYERELARLEATGR